MTVVADFLLEKFQQGLSPSTIAGYRTAIARTLGHFTGIDLGDSPQLSALLRNFEASAPPRAQVVAQWDLSLVLNVLSRDPFEPLSKCPLKLLTWKTVFLLMLASSKRRSEIHALDFKYIRWNHDKSRVSLRVVPKFIAKNQIPSSDLLSFSTPSLAASLGQSLEQDRVLCPCLLYTSPSPRDRTRSRMPSSA